MRSRISIRGCVRLSVGPSARPSVRPSVRRSHTSWNHAKVPFLTKNTISASENASYAVYPALFCFSLVNSLFSTFFSKTQPHFGRAWEELSPWFPWVVSSVFFSSISLKRILDNRGSRILGLVWAEGEKGPGAQNYCLPIKVNNISPISFPRRQLEIPSP